MTRTAIPTLAKLIRRTAQLRRDLRALMKKFPEDELELDDRIFVRLLNPLWRNPSGKAYDPKQQKQIAAVKWIERYQNYLRDVEAWICGVMLKPGLFNSLPLNKLPNLPPFQHSAAECIRRLNLQEAALRGIQNGETLPKSRDKDDKVNDLRGRLRAARYRFGIRACGVKAGLHVDTINDILNGTTRPHKKTVEKLEQYLKTIPPSEARKDAHK
jgi:hypothetical protein